MIEVKNKIFSWWLDRVVSSLTISEWCTILDYGEETDLSELLESKNRHGDALTKVLFEALSEIDLVKVVGPHAIEHIMSELKHSLPIRVGRLKAT